jgi:beta-barrel assembly-enhancing protease
MRQTRISITAFVALFVALAVDANAGLIGQKAEMRMGRDAARQIEQTYKVSNDPQLTKMVRDIGVDLAKNCERKNIEWTFKVLDIKDVNAVSVPGFVYVNQGLIEFVNGDRDELAAVIGHEIGHTAGRHAVKQAQKSMMGGVLVAVLLKGGAANAANLFTNLALLGYSRKDEYEADRLGVSLTAKAGYDPQGMVRFFTLLQEKEKHEPSKLETYFRTHPPTKERIKRAQVEIDKLRQNAPK